MATTAQVKQHFLFFLSFTFFTISSIPFPSLKKRDDFIPGFLPSANTSIPESSEKAMHLSFLDNALAFLYAFSRKVLPFSFTLKPFGAPLMMTFFIFSLGHILLISFSLSLFEEAKYIM